MEPSIWQSTFHENKKWFYGKLQITSFDPNKASSLLSSGFSPDFATVITMDRKATKQQTNIDVIYERVRDDYQLHWTSTNWKGTNTKDKWTRSLF